MRILFFSSEFRHELNKAVMFRRNSVHVSSNGISTFTLRSSSYVKLNLIRWCGFNQLMIEIWPHIFSCFQRYPPRSLSKVNLSKNTYQNCSPSNDPKKSEFPIQIYWIQACCETWFLARFRRKFSDEHIFHAVYPISQYFCQVRIIPIWRYHLKFI